MVTTIAIVLAFLLLDGLVRVLVIVALAAFEAVEISFWLRMRRRRSITGAEAIVGSTGRAMTNCRPDGTVWVKGQRWKGSSRSGVDAGDDVVVTGVQGIRLEVEPAPRGERAGSSPG